MQVQRNAVWSKLVKPSRPLKKVVGIVSRTGLSFRERVCSPVLDEKVVSLTYVSPTFSIRIVLVLLMGVKTLAGNPPLMVRSLMMSSPAGSVYLSMGAIVSPSKVLEFSVRVPPRMVSLLSVPNGENTLSGKLTLQLEISTSWMYPRVLKLVACRLRDPPVVQNS